MGILPGRIRQNGYVVGDLDASIRSWLDVLGVGPWFVMRNLVLDPYEHRGEPTQPEISIALANSGDLQLELIEATNDEPSLYREFLEAGREGLHHHAWWTDDFESVLEGVDEIEAGGAHVVGRGQMGPTRFAYFGLPSGAPAIAELMSLDDVNRTFFDAIRDAAETWDATADPVRELV